MPTLVHRNVAAARAGTNPAVIARCSAGWVVMGDHQVVPGYCLLLPDPVVGSINDLDREARQIFLAQMVSVGDALLRITDASLVNYELLGNTERALHAHISPRYDWEPPSHRGRPVWFYDRSAAPRFDAHRDAAFMDSMRTELAHLGVSVSSAMEALHNPALQPPPPIRRG